MSGLVETRNEGSAWVLTFNAPEKRNAISPEMRSLALDLLRDAVARPECRTIILTGSNGDFCSGGDLRSAAAASKPDAARTRRNGDLLNDMIRLIAAGPKPVLAAVEGHAHGAGFAIAAACDYVAASRTAKFSASFGKVGLMADAGLTWSLAQRIGSMRAKQLMLTGRTVCCDEAAALGIADEVCGPGGALDRALAAAETYGGLAPLAIAATKSALSRAPAPLEEMLSIEADLQPGLASSEDYAEGKAAFRERRPPRFRGQ